MCTFLIDIPLSERFLIGLFNQFEEELKTENTNLSERMAALKQEVETLQENLNVKEHEHNQLVENSKVSYC